MQPSARISPNSSGLWSEEKEFTPHWLFFSAVAFIKPEIAFVQKEFWYFLFSEHTMSYHLPALAQHLLSVLENQSSCKDFKLSGNI